jgi:hypothetical protein
MEIWSRFSLHTPSDSRASNREWCDGQGFQCGRTGQPNIANFRHAFSEAEACQHAFANLAVVVGGGNLAQLQGAAPFAVLQFEFDSIHLTILGAKILNSKKSKPCDASPCDLRIVRRARFSYDDLS